jgi:hypothetical protein
MVGGQPAVDHLGDFDPPLAEVKVPRGLFTAIAAVADHPNLKY